MNPLTGIEKCQNFFAKEHLEKPFIPLDEEKKISCIQEDDFTVFGSKKSTNSIYDINAFVQEAISKNTEDYVLVGTGGHGISSRAIHYYAVKGPLAVFIQLEYGSETLANEQEVHDRIEGTFAAIEYLFNAMAKVKAGEGKRLLVVQSDFYGSGWGWLSGQSEEIDPNEWHNENKETSVLFDALLGIVQK